MPFITRLVTITLNALLLLEAACPLPPFSSHTALAAPMPLPFTEPRAALMADLASRSRGRRPTSNRKSKVVHPHSSNRTRTVPPDGHATAVASHPSHSAAVPSTSKDFSEPSFDSSAGSNFDVRSPNCPSDHAASIQALQEHYETAQGDAKDLGRVYHQMGFHISHICRV